MTCQRVVILNRGRLVAEDSPEGLTARLLGKTAISVRLMNSGEGPEETLNRLEFVQSWESLDEGDSIHLNITPAADEDIRPRLARALVESGQELLELNETRLSLEDVFLELTTEESEELPEEPPPSEVKAGDESNSEPLEQP